MLFTFLFDFSQKQIKIYDAGFSHFLREWNFFSINTNGVTNGKICCYFFTAFEFNLGFGSTFRFISYRFLFRSEILFRTLKQLFLLVVVAWYQVSHTTVHAVTVTYHIFSSNMIFWNDHPAILGRIPNKCNINDYDQRQKISSAHSFKGSSINVGILINREGRKQWFSIGVLRNPWVPWKALGVPLTFEVDD